MMIIPERIEVHLRSTMGQEEVRNARSVIESMLPGGKLARNVAILIGGTLIAQGLAVVTAPVLSRLYSPADYGVFNLFSSIGLII